MTDDRFDETFLEIDSLSSDNCGNSGFAEIDFKYETQPAEPVRDGCGIGKVPFIESPPDFEFPIGALGNILGGAAERFAYYVQAPTGMAAQAVLGAAAYVAQGHINVSRGRIGKGPTSLFLLTVGGSGDRKSSLDSLALKPVRDFEENRRKEYELLRAKYIAELDAWKLRRDSVVESARPKRSTKILSEDNERKLAEDLSALELVKPLPPKLPNVTFEEPTAEGVWRHFQHGLASAGLYSDEGGAFFNGHGMAAEAKGRMITLMSGLWDGKPMTRTRAAEGESGVMAARRLSAHLMVQPVIAAKVLSDPLLLGQGFLARFLVCNEKSIAGARLLSERSPEEDPESDPEIKQYFKRMETLLERPLDVDEQSGELRFKELSIEGQAYLKWVWWHDDIERQLAGDGAYSDITAFASKAAENLARIAAVLAYVEESTITSEHIDRAGKITQYYLKSMSVHTSAALIDQDEINAMKLEQWITDKGGTLSAQDFNKLPSKLRSAKIARKLLGLLKSMGRVRVTAIGPTSKPVAWELIPDHPNNGET